MNRPPRLPEVLRAGPSAPSVAGRCRGPARDERSRSLTRTGGVLGGRYRDPYLLGTDAQIDVPVAAVAEAHPELRELRAAAPDRATAPGHGSPGRSSPRWTKSRVPAIAPRWMPSAVVPPWTSATSPVSASSQYVQASGRWTRARTQAWTRALSVEPCAGAVQVVIDGGVPGVVVEWISPTGGTSKRVPRREEIAQHQHIGLFGGLIAVDRVALRLQDPVQPADVP